MSTPTAPARHVWIYVLLVMTMFFWGGNFVVGRAMHDEIGPVAMSFWRWSIAWLVFLPFAWRDMRAQAGLIKQHWFRLAALGVLGMTGFHTLIYAALQTTVAVNAMLIMATSPIWIAIMGRLIYADKVTPRQAIGILISLGGVAAIVLRGDFAGFLSLAIENGDIIMICSVPLWGLYTVTLKRMPPDFRPMTMLGGTMTFGVLILLPVYIWETTIYGGFDITPATLSTLFYFGIITSAVAYTCWNKAVATLGPNRTGIFMNLVPLFGSLLAVFFLGEVLRPFHAIGAVFIFSGIYLTTAKRGS